MGPLKNQKDFGAERRGWVGEERGVYGGALGGRGRWCAGGVGLPWPLGDGGARKNRLKQPPLVLRYLHAPPSFG